MKNLDPSFHFSHTVIALAVCAALAPAYAQTTAEATIEEETRSTQASVTLGLGLVSGDNADRSIYNQYNALGQSGSAGGLLGFDYSVRDPETATLLQIDGANLFDDSRELGLVWREPGEWKLTANYGELVHRDPHTLNTGLLGAGSTTPQVVHLNGGVGTGSEFELETKRKALGLGFAKWISPALQFEVDLKSENKAGSRLYGTGMNCPSPIAPGCEGSTGIAAGWASLMLPEPIDSNQTQIEARMNYAVDKLRLSVNYYGSFYTNHNGTLNPSVPGSLNNALGGLTALSAGLQPILSQPIALAPDNQFNQLSLTGTYDLAQKTRASFKLSYARATQDQEFASAGLAGAPAGVSNLGGEVTSTLAWLGITSRPMPKLTLQADLRYANRDDDTPIAPYTLYGATSSTNQRLPEQKTSGKLQASYQFSSEYRGTLGADYASVDRGSYTATSRAGGISALRQDTNETGLYGELRRSLSESLSGAIRLSGSQRDGSNWLKPNAGTGVSETPESAFFSSAIFMPTLADRKQEKIKIFADWQPDDKLNVQFSAEGGTNKYSMPTVYALQKTRLSLFSLDVGYALAYNWNLNGYASWGQQTQNQARPAGSVVAYDNTNRAAGFGVTGNPTGKWQVGGTLSYVNDKSVYAQTLDTYAEADSAALLAASGGLPNIVFRETALKLFGKYAIDKKSSVGFNLIYARVKFDDWAYDYNGTPYAYSDNTTVNMDQNQNTSYLGVVYTFKY